MCDMGASLIMTGITTALSMAGQAVQASQASSAAKAQAGYQQAALDQQKQVNERQAQDAVQRGIEAKNQHERNAARIMGEQRSALAASGVTLDSGSPLAMLVESAEEAQHDSNTITQNAAREAWGYQVSANNAENEKSLVASSAKNTASQAWTKAAFGMGDSLLGGIGTGMGQHKKWKESQQ